MQHLRDHWEAILQESKIIAEALSISTHFFAIYKQKIMVLYEDKIY